MAKKAITIADWFIARATKESAEGTVEGITPLKLQKILYLAQSAHLGLGKGPLFDDEIVAWKYGPVVQEVYMAYKTRRDPIVKPKNNDYLSLNEDTNNFLEDVWKLFGKYTAYKLVELTHSHLPWKEAKEGQVIKKDRIAEYYKDLFTLSDEES